MTAESITAKAMRGAGWAFCWRMVTRLLGLLSTLILVRLLEPADFGLVALAAAFAGAVDALSNMGTDYALIREKSPDRALYDTAFTLNLGKGLLSGAIIAAAALPVAAFLNEPRLAPALWAIALISALASAENIGTVDFRRSFAFAQEFKLFLAPRLLGIIATITCAFTLRSYWALLIGVAVTRLGRLGFSYVMHPYRPRISLAAWRQLLGFSFWVWATSMISLIRGRADSLVIGRMTGPASVGFFTIGTEIATLPTSEIMGPVTRSLFPAFAALEHSGGSAGAAYLRVVGMVMTLIMPACIGISLLADPLVRLAFGTAWLEVIPVIQIVAVTGIFQVISLTAGNALGVRGDMRLLFWLSVPGACLRIPLMVGMVALHGLPGAALTLVFLMGLETILYVIVTARRLAFHPAALLIGIWRCTLASAIMAAALIITGWGWTAGGAEPWALALHLGLGAALGGTVFLLSLLTLWAMSGRPDGAEATAITTAARLLRQRARCSNRI